MFGEQFQRASCAADDETLLMLFHVLPRLCATPCGSTSVPVFQYQLTLLTVKMLYKPVSTCIGTTKRLRELRNGKLLRDTGTAV
jgi:hypothetical protein